MNCIKSPYSFVDIEIEQPADFVARSANPTINLLDMLIFRKRQMEESNIGEVVHKRVPKYLLK